MKKAIYVFSKLVFLFGAAVFCANAQMTIFKYQGSLRDGGTPANGSFQMQFKLFDAVSGGNQIGPTLTDLPVAFVDGIFTVSLDFGSNPLNGANRWLEIAVRHNSGESYVTLSPREQISSSPYSLRTISAAIADDSQKLGGVSANQFVQTNDVRLTDDRNPLPNSPSYIQNQNTSPQAASNFNISGSGTATSLNVNGPFSFGATTAPAVAPAGQGRFYFDNATNRFRISENGNPFVNLVGSGISGTGTVNKVPLWSAGTTIGDSLIAQTNSNIGINTSSPQSRFHTVGTSWFQGDNTPLPAAAGKGIAMGFAGEQGYLYGFDYGAFAAKNLIINGPGGSVGIGRTPTHTLDVNGFFRASNTAGGNVVSETDGGTNAWARFWAKTPTQQWAIGTSNNFNGNQLYFSNENAGGGIRMAIMPNGNMVQNMPGYGLPKAMLYIDEAGSILRCYNGVTGSSSGNCGFSVARPGTGQINVDFGFEVQNTRFVSITPGVTGGSAAVINFLFSSPNVIIYLVYNSATFGAIDRKAMVVVY